MGLGATIEEGQKWKFKTSQGLAWKLDNVTSTAFDGPKQVTRSTQRDDKVDSTSL